MRELRETTRVGVPPRHIWMWLSRLPEHYTDWHPDHVSAEWVRGRPNQIGSILRIVEILGGRRESHHVELTAAERPFRLEYMILEPIGLLLPKGAFYISPSDGGSEFTAIIYYRFGWLTERFFRRRMEALQEHMREEGERLRLLVAGGVGNRLGTPGDGDEPSRARSH